jgi:hypothetical protein
MPRSRFGGASLLALVTWLVWPGCEQSVAERCLDIETLLLVRGEQLPRRCESDGDCQIVEVRPGLPAVTSEPLDDPFAEALVQEYTETCGPFQRRYRSARALCEEGPDGRRCVLRAEGLPPDFLNDAGVDTTGDVEVTCECRSAADCPDEAPSCADCLCLDACGLACHRADLCGVLFELGFGRNLADCQTRCQDLESRDSAAAEALIRCLQTAECDEISTCE